MKCENMKTLSIKFLHLVRGKGSLKSLRDVEYAWIYLIKSTPKLYFPLVYLLKRSRYYKLCNKNTLYTIESYPSSGSSFFYNYFRGLLYFLENGKFLLSLKEEEEKFISHHSHSVANIKKSIKNKSMTIIIIRNPLDSISSRVVRFGTNINRAIYEYRAYYEFLNNNVGKIYLVKFKNLRDNLPELTNNILDMLNQTTKHYIKDDVVRSFEKITKDYIIIWNKSYGTKETISLPLDIREKQKDKVKKQLIKINAFSDCINLYDSICKRIARTGTCKNDKV